ncbi:hypothetical protein [Leucobacter chironomi]|uniref:hypothetical protein n=1 Tax=Leucobacter chironomi TaxID=491918 RepID=UPI0004278674|nr:hypothetical protein [Leucobacter chironomi]
MTSPLRPDDPRLSRHRVFATDAELHELVELLLARASRRQLWLFAFDDRQRQLGPLMPMEDLPESPDELVETEDLGLVSIPHVLADRAAMVCEVLDAASIALVWERRGSERFDAQDRAWARALAHETAQQGLRLRAQFVLHDEGVRQLTPDDYA